MYSYLPPRPAEKHLAHFYFILLRFVLLLIFFVLLSDLLSAQPRTLKANGLFYKKNNMDKIPPEQTLRVLMNFNNGFVEITWSANLKGDIASFYSIVEGNSETFCVVVDATFEKNRYERVGSVSCRSREDKIFFKKYSKLGLTSIINYHVYFLSEDNKILNSIDIPIQFFNKEINADYFSKN